MLNPNPEDPIDTSQIDAIQLNNLFRQLQDNDRFVKQHISHIKMQDGSPKSYSSDQVNQLPDGSKMMGGAGTDELVIEQKIILPVSATIEKVGIPMDILCTRNFGNWLLVGTSDGLYATTDGVGYEGPMPVYPEVDVGFQYTVEEVVIGEDSVEIVEDEDSEDEEDDQEDDREDEDVGDEDYGDVAIFDFTDPDNDLVFAAA